MRPIVFIVFSAAHSLHAEFKLGSHL